MLIAKAKMLGLDQAVTGIVVGYVVIYVVALGLALRLPKDKSTKALAAVMVTAVFGLPVLMLNQKSQDAQKIVTTQKSEYMAKYEPAKAIFDKLCKEQSAPIIKRTVADVEGVLLLKVRPAVGSTTYENSPTWPEAALPGFGRLGEGAFEGYPESFLMDWNWRERSLGDPPKIWRTWERHWSVGGQQYQFAVGKSRGFKTASMGFRYVDVASSDGASRARITAKNAPAKHKHPFPGVVFESQATSKPAPRYAVTFDDNLDPALRKHWIAGTVVRIVDMVTDEELASQSFWKLDAAFGALGQSTPWITGAKTCVPNIRDDASNAFAFIFTVLKAKQGE